MDWPIGRTCENCGNKMPPFSPRMRDPETGKLICKGCAVGDHPAQMRAHSAEERAYHTHEDYDGDEYGHTHRGGEERSHKDIKWKPWSCPNCGNTDLFYDDPDYADDVTICGNCNEPLIERTDKEGYAVGYKVHPNPQRTGVKQAAQVNYQDLRHGDLIGWKVGSDKRFGVVVEASDEGYVRVQYNGMPQTLEEPKVLDSIIVVRRRASKTAQDEFDMPPACPACDGPLETMGILGNREWARCRNCGSEFSVPVGDESGEDVRREGQRTSGYLQVVAHDSGDGQRIFHCPFCGSGQVTGRPDGTVECGYCKNAFTVQTQPMRSAMPQTDPKTGEPIEIPGMPGQRSDPMSNPQGLHVVEQEPGGPQALPQVSPQIDPVTSAKDGPTPEQRFRALYWGGASVPIDGPVRCPKCGKTGFKDETEVAQHVEGEKGALEAIEATPQWMDKGYTGKRYYIASDGLAMSEESYIKHLAIRYADDPALVKESLRSGRDTVASNGSTSGT